MSLCPVQRPPRCTVSHRRCAVADGVAAPVEVCDAHEQDGLWGYTSSPHTGMAISCLYTILSLFLCGIPSLVDRLASWIQHLSVKQPPNSISWSSSRQTATTLSALGWSATATRSKAERRDMHTHTVAHAAEARTPGRGKHKPSGRPAHCAGLVRWQRINTSIQPTQQAAAPASGSSVRQQHHTSCCVAQQAPVSDGAAPVHGSR